MSDFWNLGNDAPPVSGNMDMGGGDFEPIPARTQVLAALEEIKWDDHDGSYYINGTWSILAPDAYKGRKVFQKIRVEDKDIKKREKALRMLAAIDANAGGQLLASGGKPTNEDMTRHLCNKPMMLMLQIWKLEDDSTGETKKGNWVSAVSPKGSASPSQPATQQPATQQTSTDEGFSFDDDIPFG